MTLYLRDGAVDAKAYHYSCMKCKTQHWHSYRSSRPSKQAETSRTYLYDAIGCVHFMLSSRTAFSTKYLTEVVTDIELGRSFEDVKERYNRLYGRGTETHRGDVGKQRIEDAFFIVKLLNHFKSDVEVNVSAVSNRIDIDAICDEVLTEIFSHENQWKDHICDVVGCKEGFVVCDGNEKLSRRICAAPKNQFKLSRSMPKIMSRCGHSPVFGGSGQAASKFCKLHQHLESDEPLAKVPRIILTINLPDQIVSTRIVELSGSLPSNEDTTMHTACKKKANVKHFHDRTAGIMAIVRSCGIILDWREMYTCESSSQLFVQLLKLVDEPNIRISYIGYDRACEFVPFLRNLNTKGNLGAAKLLEAEYLVDNFHIAGHTTPGCLPPSPDNPKSEFHHSLPKFSAIANANTEVAEQAFSWLKRYKHIVKYMSAAKYRYFLYEIIQSHNKRIDKRSVGL